MENWKLEYHGTPGTPYWTLIFKGETWNMYYNGGDAVAALKAARNMEAQKGGQVPYLCQMMRQECDALYRAACSNAGAEVVESIRKRLNRFVDDLLAFYKVNN